MNKFYSFFLHEMKVVLNGIIYIVYA